MREVVPGVFDWVAIHPKLRIPVHCHYLAAPGALIDPLLPEEGLDWFREQAAPARVVLTSRHHDRDSAHFAEAFGCPVLCNEAGLHEFEGREPEVEGFAPGDEVARGVSAHGVLADWPDETALFVEEAGLLILGDCVIRDEREALAFVPEQFMDDAEQEKQAIRAGLRQLLELDFDHLLLAHGPPWIGGAKAALREFAG